jgi:hypothetical protein
MSNKEASYRATANKARTIFSPHPNRLKLRKDALILKNVELNCEAMHFPIRDFSCAKRSKKQDAFWRTQ